MNRNVCRHWNGSINSECGKGINWSYTYKNALTCIDSERKKGHCEHYKCFTPEEITMQEEETKKHVEKFKKMLIDKKSHCCNADIYESHVIKNGAHKGHGPRFCGKCKETLFMV